MRVANKHRIIAIGLGFCSAIAGAAPIPTNLLTNGSFEDGLSNWTHGGTTASNPVVAINYNSATPYPTGAYGESVPVPTDMTLSPDAPGMHGAYFVDDHSVNESLSQTIFLLAGSYRIGFDVYAPANGYANPVDARFNATIANVQLASYLVSANAATTWMNFSGLAQIQNSGFYSAAFLFNTPGTGAAKDIVIDRAYVIAVNERGGVSIPEPGSIALFGIAAGALVAMRKRRA